VITNAHDKAIRAALTYLRQIFSRRQLSKRWAVKVSISTIALTRRCPSPCGSNRAVPSGSTRAVTDADGNSVAS
jgi:hypothetical protein